MNKIVKNDDIRNLIYEIRGKRVMLDSDLARLYQCKNGTKSINLVVRRNIEKFPERFCFQLTREEYYGILRFQIETLELEQGKYSKYLPFVFTEQGVAMLATLIKTSVATKVSIQIMDAFVAMRHFINENRDILNNILYMNNELIENKKQLRIHEEKIKELFSKFEVKEAKEKIFFEGQIYDAYSKLTDIISKAKKELIIVDGYADKTVLDMISKIKANVVLIVKKKALLKEIDIIKYNKQYHNLKVIYSDNFHDRFIILDKKEIYHCGTSLNYAGKRSFAINKLEDKELNQMLLKNIENIIK